MGVYIKGMEMPKSCYECLVRNQGFSGDGMKCGKTGSVLSWYDGNRKRMDNCPLVSVKEPHGRLGDLDEIVRYKERLVVDADKIIPEIRYVVDTKYIVEAPTIIPAEEGQ